MGVSMVMPVVGMSVIVTVAMPARVIGTFQRQEGLNDVHDLGSEAHKHLPDDMVPLDEDALRLDLRWQMPVTDVPGQLRNADCGSRPNLHQRLIRGNHLDQPSIVQFERITRLEHRRLTEIEKDCLAGVNVQPPPAHVALIGGKGY